MKKRGSIVLLVTIMALSMIFSACSSGGKGGKDDIDSKRSVAEVSDTETESAETSEEAELLEEEIQEEGWVMLDNMQSMYLDDDQLETFQTVTEGFAQENLYYSPIAVLATQVVNGVNYMFLVYENQLDGNNYNFSYKILIANSSSDGSKSLLSIQDFDMNCQKTLSHSEDMDMHLCGGWMLNPELTEGVFFHHEDESFRKAMENYHEKELLPVYAFAKKLDDEAQMKYFALTLGEDGKINELFIVNVEKDDAGNPVIAAVRTFNCAGYNK
ncbi:MAG: hypothetical protein MJ097_02465 [Dorea sp.]|nr:hypothetical protein [Dorea sp.]